MEITVNNVQQKTQLPQNFEESIQDCVRCACSLEGLEDYEVGITIMDDEGIRLLNRDYRGLDTPTDVLSFSVMERSEDEPEIIEGGDEELLILGDIVISAEAVERQAEEYGHSVRRELCFLVVHGVLHLLGYDHQDEDAEKAMFQKQTQILEQLNISRQG